MLCLLGAAILSTAGGVDTRFAAVGPERAGGIAARSPGQGRAVVLIHGLRTHPFSAANVQRAAFQDWQQPGSRLVRALARDSDVYSFAYSQNVSLDEVAGSTAFAEAVGRLRGLGYAEVVLVGHSAGGLIARQFVEDHPDAGVTKVIQVCAPNAGSSWARLHPSVVRGQEEFLRSLTREGRRRELAARLGKRLPEAVQFVCLVGTGEVLGDGLVACTSQWPEDLQAQGAPAYGVFAIHTLVMRTEPGVARIAELARAGLPRWTPEQVAAVRHKLLHRADPKGLVARKGGVRVQP